MVTLIIILFLCKISSAKIVVNDESRVLADYVQYVFENQTRKTQGFIGIIVNDNDNHAVEESLINIHRSKTNSFFLINFNYFERDKPKS